MEAPLPEAKPEPESAPLQAPIPSIIPSEEPQFFIPEDSKPSSTPPEEATEPQEPITPDAEPQDHPPERKTSMIPKHLAALRDPPRSSKPLTPLQELLAVVNSTVENDSQGGATSEPESQPPVQESIPLKKPLKPLARLKQGVEQCQKLAPGGKQKLLGGLQKKTKGQAFAPNLKKTKKGMFKGGLKRTKAVLPEGVDVAPGGGVQIALGDAPKTPLKKETAAEMKKRVSQVAALLGREETPEEKRSHKKKIPLINIGERILIYWPMDGVFYSGKVVEHVVAKHRYTVLYDDNEMEVLDLSKEIWRPGTLDPKKERMPGEGIPPPELGLPSEGDIPHYMPPRKRRRFEKMKKWGGQTKGPKDAKAEGVMKKRRKKMKVPESGGEALGASDEGAASVQEMGAIEALLGVAGNRFGGNTPTFGAPSGNGLGRRDSEERGPIFIGLKRKRSKKGEGKLIRLAATLDRTANGGYFPGHSNGWTSPKGGFRTGGFLVPSSEPARPPRDVGANLSDVSDVKRPQELNTHHDKLSEQGQNQGFMSNGAHPDANPLTADPVLSGGKPGVNGGPVPLPPEIQQILSDFEKKKMEKEEGNKGKAGGPGKRGGHKRKRKFTPKPKGSTSRHVAKAQPLVRKRSFGETQFVELACGGALLVSAAETDGAGPRVAKAGGEMEVEKVGGETMKAEEKMPEKVRTGSRLMRSAAVVAQRRIEATAGGTIAPAEVEAYRRGGIELPRKRNKRESAPHPSYNTPPGSVPASVPDPTLQTPKTEPPVAADPPNPPASRRLWWKDVYGGQNRKPANPPEDALSEQIPKLSNTAEDAPGGQTPAAFSPVEDETKPKEGVGETKEGPGFVRRPGLEVRLGSGEKDPCLENGHDVSGVNGHAGTPTSVNAPPGNDSEHSPRDEVVNTEYGASPGEGVKATNGVDGPGAPAEDGVNRTSVTGVSEMDGVNGASDTAGVNGRGVNGIPTGKEAPGGVNMHGPETSRVESDSTAALPLHTENGSSGQMGGAWQKVAAKTLADVGGVQKWLEHVGLGRLVGLFTEHEVVDDALPHLTSDDLKEMGVKAVGTRRLILNNIELLKQGVLGEAQESVSQ
ncbi:hypothetical protein KFL_000700160 [Klebsormidium nitens]|uniref:SAM domain-containing protein n=1 Tax=Klebsormidium nitens TaxID=105231 RepID=A0A1Y1HV61_KLENI|nr:hypothetical protein KFL_000700160 [Klebsormidium nitens]|eukprot:GAQ81079.1 hypothetical protein KFL_000700160 [Klebsormidium nitens]